MLEDVRGTHKEGFSNADVNYLDIVYQNLTYLPTNIETFFPNLKGITYFRFNLKQVSANDLKPFPQLAVFTVYGGDITTLDDLLKYTPNLKWIAFTNNELQHIGENLLGNLAVQSVNFVRNTCINTAASSDRAAIIELNRRLPILCPARSAIGGRLI